MITDSSPRHTPDHDQELVALLGLARRSATLTGGPLGPRDLLVAAAITTPRRLIEQARASAIDPARLITALSEWWPDPEGDGSPEPLPVSPTVRAALTRALDAVEQETSCPIAALLAVLLAPDSLLLPLLPVGPDGTSTPSTTDRTMRVLRAYALI